MVEAAPICLSVLCSILPSPVNRPQITDLLHLRQEPSFSLNRAAMFFRVRIIVLDLEMLILSLAGSHSAVNHSCAGCSLGRRDPAEPCQLKKAGSKSGDPQPRPLRSLEINGTGYRGLTEAFWAQF